MCGLLGFSKTTDLTKRLTAPLALMMAERGRSSWGVTDGDAMFKQVGDICDTFAELDLEAPSYHTRAPSCGSVCEANAHPFEWISQARGIRVVGMHNGHIANHADLKAKYSPSRDGIEVDSHHIFAHLAEGLDLGELGGYGTVIWYEMPIGKPQERRRYLSTFNSTALSIARLKSGECVYASTESAISTALKLCGASLDCFYRIDANIKYTFSDDGSGLERCGKLKWASNIYHTPVMHHQFHQSQRTTFSHGAAAMRLAPSDECMGLGCRNKVTEEQIVCSGCIERAKRLYQGRGKPLVQVYEGALC